MEARDHGDGHEIERAEIQYVGAVYARHAVEPQIERRQLDANESEPPPSATPPPRPESNFSDVARLTSVSSFVVGSVPRNEISEGTAAAAGSKARVPRASREKRRAQSHEPSE
jgi:hypothetical protein